ncbi:MAG: GTP-binding protein, partial [Spirochaetales bacterium]|nr:GTP-binding protein [Spirochaetales bacterium]
GKLDNVVGVVDAARLVDEFASGDSLLKKDEIEEEDIESLLIQQIEFCSTLIINKIDLVSESDLAKVRKVVQALHPGVHVIETSHGDVPVKDILATGSFDFDEVYGAAGWCKALEEGELGDDEDDDYDDDDHEEHHEHHHHDHDDHDDDDDDDDDHDHEEHEGHGHHHHHEHRHEGESEDEYGIGTYIYYRRVPMNRAKLRSFVNNWPRNIIRCKGLMWFGDEYDTAYIFETSGRQLLCGPYGKWVASAPAAQRRQILANNPSIREDWDDKVGDRMVRLCIIGKNLDKKAIASILDRCLCTEEEIEK